MLNLFSLYPAVLVITFLVQGSLSSYCKTSDEMDFNTDEIAVTLEAGDGDELSIDAGEVISTLTGFAAGYIPPPLGDAVDLINSLIGLVPDTQEDFDDLAEALYDYVDQQISESLLTSAYTNYYTKLNEIRNALESHVTRVDDSYMQHIDNAYGYCFESFGNEVGSSSDGLLFYENGIYEEVTSRDRLFVAPMFCNLCLATQLAYIEYGKNYDISTSDFEQQLSVILNRCIIEILPLTQDVIEEQKTAVLMTTDTSATYTMDYVASYQGEEFSRWTVGGYGTSNIETSTANVNSHYDCVEDLKADLYDFWMDHYEADLFTYSSTWATTLVQTNPNGLLASDLADITDGDEFTLMSVNHDAYFTCEWGIALDGYDSGLCSVQSKPKYLTFVGSHTNGFYLKFGNGQYLCEPTWTSPYVKRVANEANVGDYCLWTLDQPNADDDPTKFRFINVSTGHYLRLPNGASSYEEKDGTRSGDSLPIAKANTAGYGGQARYRLIRNGRDVGEACDFNGDCKSQSCDYDATPTVCF